MNILAASATQQPDYIALAMVAVLAVIVVVMVVRKRMDAKKTPAAAATPAAAPAKEPAKAPGSAGSVMIHDVSPKTAAMLMAITADKMGKPLNELRFISIKEVK